MIRVVTGEVAWPGIERAKALQAWSGPKAVNRSPDWWTIADRNRREIARMEDTIGRFLGIETQTAMR
jgi:hypothetical protein